MEESTGDVDSYHHAYFSTPFSQRELSALHLEWETASDDAERKHILDEAGMTVEEFSEHFDMDHPGVTDGD